MKLGSLLLRTTVGPIFIGHGSQKLFGVAGGAGLKTTGEFFEGIGLKPGLAHATAAGVAETAGGAGLLLGYRTPLASSAIVATMITAIERVHGRNGWNTQKGGYEYNLVLIAAALAVVDAGPGKLSIDGLTKHEKSGFRWALLSLALGAAGSAGAHYAAEFFGGGSEAPSFDVPESSSPVEAVPPVAAVHPVPPVAAVEPIGPVEPVDPSDGP